MRPTFSIICFTVLSGLGYGVWFLIGLGFAIGPVCAPRGAPGVSGITLAPCQAPFVSSTGLLLAFVLVSAGLLCSLGHLGQPQRAWRALSQWRTSWLSREGVLALLTFVPALALLAQRVGERFGARPALPYAIAPRLLGVALCAGAALTVFCTANIYASLKPIAAWRLRHVVPAYLLLGVYGGALLLAAGTTSLGGWLPVRDTRTLLLVVIALAMSAAWLKSSYWRAIDALAARDAGHATGLDALGNVRSFEQPHTEQNYLTHEMGFVLARKHGRKLRVIALLAAFAIPALLALLGFMVPAMQPVAVWLALASGVLGLFFERWLFFAEAKHAVMAYYAR